MFPHEPVGSFNPQEQNSAVAGTDITRLIECHRSYAHAIAAEVANKLPPELDSKDIRGAAELGLVEAANSFDPTRGVQFKTFAYYRIKGAIYDALRTIGWFPKSQYQHLRFEMAANEYLKDLSSESRSSVSAAAQLEYLKHVTADLLSCYMLSLEAMAEEPQDHQHSSAEEMAVLQEQRRNVRRSLAQLPETNRRILEYCYFQDLTLEQVGQKLGLSKSWVCRLHAKSLEMLRRQLVQTTARTAVPAPATFSAGIR